jgi:hypothetical protein
LLTHLIQLVSLVALTRWKRSFVIDIKIVVTSFVVLAN